MKRVDASRTLAPSGVQMQIVEGRLDLRHYAIHILAIRMNHNQLSTGTEVEARSKSETL